MAKWPRVKLKKKKNMWVKKVVEALGDSWQGPTQLQFPPKYIENTFRLSKLLNSMRRLIIMTTIRVIHWETGLFSIEIIRATILFFREFWNFLWFLLYHNFVSENFSSPYMEKTCLVYKSHPPPPPSLRACSLSRLDLVDLAMRAFTDTDLIWSGRSDRNVPFHLTKLFSPGPLICTLLPSTITKIAVALVWSVQPECTVPLGTWIFRNFKQKFLLNGKRAEGFFMEKS